MVLTTAWLRGGVARLATTGVTRRLVQAPRVSQDVVSRFVAGESAPQALDVAARLAGRGRLIALVPLRATPLDEQQARDRLDWYISILAASTGSGLDTRGRPDLSLPLSALGATIPGGGVALARSLATRLCRAAANAGLTLTVETEDAVDVDVTLATVAQLRSDFPDVGVTLVAARRRTATDCRELAGPGARVRLTKGLPGADPDSYPGRTEVDRAYVRCLRTLLSAPGYPSIATHDLRVVAIVEALAGHLGRDPDEYEYLMRFGVRTETQITIADRGDRIRVYLPFGPDWYDYVVQRVVDRPGTMVDLVRAAVGR